MKPGFSNVYNDRARAESYAALAFPGTYCPAHRDVPAIINEWASFSTKDFPGNRGALVRA